MHGIHIIDQGVFTNEKLCHGNTQVDGRSVRVDGVCSYSFISMWDVESWESGFEMFSQGQSSGCHSPLSGVLKRLLDGISIDPTKIRL